MKNPNNVLRGRKARKSGGQFERRVRQDMEEKGWIITKWNNQVDFEKDKLIQAPHKFNFFNKSIQPGQGFPDFLCYIKKQDDTWLISGIEAKSAKYLDAIEKKKCKWLLEHHIFDQILVAYKDKKGHIAYYKYE